MSAGAAAGAPEDRRQAATIFAAVSNYVATGTVALAAGCLALITYFASAYDRHLVWFYVAIGLALVALCVSMIFGGKGQTTIAKRGASGDWDISERNDNFNTQAVFGVIGIALMALATLLAVTVGLKGANHPAVAVPDAVSKLDTKLSRQEAAIVRLEGEVSRLQAKSSR